MSGLLFWLPVVKMSWEKNSKKKPILLVNFCFLIHFDFSNTRIFSFSVGIKVMNPKMPLCNQQLFLSDQILTTSISQIIDRSDDVLEKNLSINNKQLKT